MQVYVSKMSGKLTGFRAVNTSPLTNEFCQKMEQCEGVVCAHCYSLYQMRTYRLNMIPRAEQNSALLSSHPLKRQEIPRFDIGELVRFNAHGELINEQHFLNLIEIARDNPETTFALWTKRIELVSPHLDAVPENLRLIYSHPQINPGEVAVPEGFDQVFTVYTPEYAAEHGIEINCQRRCAECQQCYTSRGGGVRVVRELLK